MTIDIEGKSYKCCHTIPYHPTIETLFDQLEEYLTSCNTNVNELFDFLKNTATLLYENHYLRVIAKRYLTQLLTNASKGSIVVGLQAARLARPKLDAMGHGFESRVTAEIHYLLSLREFQLVVGIDRLCQLRQYIYFNE